MVAKAGETLLDSGEPSPSDPDGAAVFESSANWTLVQNHEIGGSETYGVPALARACPGQGRGIASRRCLASGF